MKRIGKKSHSLQHHHKLVLLGMTGFLAMFFLLMPKPAVQALDIGVSATVPGTPPPSGGGAPPIPPPPDLTPPIISNIRVPVIGPTNAEVAWDTNESANSSVDYGLTLAYEMGTVSNGAFVFSRQLPIDSLSANTMYHFRVRSVDTSGNSAQSGDNTFTTLSTNDTAPPIISGITVTNITTTSAYINWTTDELADSTVQYGLDATYGTTGFQPARSLSHVMTEAGLTPGTLYHFIVQSTDASNNTAVSTDHVFMTLSGIDLTPPANVSNLIVSNVPGQPALQLDWTNPTDSDFARVIVRARTDTYPTDARDGRGVYSGIANATLDAGLVPGTTYYYSLFSVDTTGNESSGTHGIGTIPLGTTFTMLIHPEKRVPRTGNWDIDGTLLMRTPGTMTFRDNIAASVPDSGSVLLNSFLDPGRFDAAFKGLGYLRTVIPNFNLAASGSVADFTRGGTFDAKGGDVHPSNDNLVNALDISTLLGKLNSGFVVTDLNRDGLVNALDLSYQLANLSKRGDN